MGFGGALRRLASSGLTGGAGGDSVEGGRGGGRVPGSFGGPVGGFGADTAGGLGRVASESDRYAASRFAPVFTPPRLRSFGMPPANRPPNWGAVDGTLECPPSSPERPSLLLRNRFADGAGGASPPGGLGMPGIGGAPPIAGPLDFVSVPMMGADLSLVTAFFNRAPLEISCNSALCLTVSYLHENRVSVISMTTSGIEAVYNGSEQETYPIFDYRLCGPRRKIACRRWGRRRRTPHCWGRRRWWRWRRSRHLYS
jgi:hypothetical protein